MFNDNCDGGSQPAETEQCIEMVPWPINCACSLHRLLVCSEIARSSILFLKTKCSLGIITS